MVVHLLASAEGIPATASAGPRVGFVVSKAVGPAVTRNLVKRRLRHLCRERLPVLPSGSMLVIRALPAAAGASYHELGGELDRSLAKVAVTTDVPAKAVIGR
jgi:ribonuclease P protein component